MSLTYQLQDWRSRSACRSADPELFFPLSAAAACQPQIDRAKAICARCPVRQECLIYASVTRQVYGIWGGTTEEERYQLRQPASGSPAGGLKRPSASEVERSAAAERKLPVPDAG
jgi:WhiB family transcriptional regulator, redox-sensing transcriptional regulator